jgi:hypothetical protein
MYKKSAKVLQKPTSSKIVGRKSQAPPGRGVQGLLFAVSAQRETTKSALGRRLKAAASISRTNGDKLRIKMPRVRLFHWKTKKPWPLIGKLRARVGPKAVSC